MQIKKNKFVRGHAEKKNNEQSVSKKKKNSFKGPQKKKIMIGQFNPKQMFFTKASDKRQNTENTE